MSKVLPVFLILVSFLLSSSVLPRFGIGANFDTGIIMVICYGLVKGEVKGAAFGFFAGLINGMLMANMVGLFALLGFIAGFISGIFREDGYERSLIVTILIVLGVVFAYQSVSYLVQTMFLGQFGSIQRLHLVVIPKTILTTALFVPVYLFVGFVIGKVKRVELA